MHPQLNWIERLATDQKVRGSNPFGCTKYLARFEVKTSNLVSFCHCFRFYQNPAFPDRKCHISATQNHSVCHIKKMKNFLITRSCSFDWKEYEYSARCSAAVLRNQSKIAVVRFYTNSGNRCCNFRLKKCKQSTFFRLKKCKMVLYLRCKKEI